MEFLSILFINMKSNHPKSKLIQVFKAPARGPINYTFSKSRFILWNTLAQHTRINVLNMGQLFSLYKCAA